MSSQKLFYVLVFYFLLPNTSFAKPYIQQDSLVRQMVSGRLLSSNGIGIENARVTQKGDDRIFTTTDRFGNFNIVIDLGNEAVLKFSAVGHKDGEYVVSKDSLLDAIYFLEELVNIGYGTIPKSIFGGSITTIRSVDFNTGFIVRPEQLVIGRVPGLNVISDSGSPGAGSQIQLRGVQSLLGATPPTIVIDGVPSDFSDIGYFDPLSFVNPFDVESIEVLKDASGYRGLNGALLLNGKKGRKGEKFQFDFDSQLGISSLVNQVSMLSAEQYRSVVNTYGDPAYLGNASTDWQKEIYRDAISQRADVAVKGGIKALPYRVSFGYLSQNGIVQTSKFDRFSTSINMTPSFFSDHLKFDLNYKYVKTKSNFPDSRTFEQALSFDPTQPIFESNGSGEYFEYRNPDGSYPFLGYTNPLNSLYKNVDFEEVDRGIGNIKASYSLHFFPAITVTANYGFIDSNSGRSIFKAFPEPTGNRGTNSEQARSNTVFDVYLNYFKKFEFVDSRVDFTIGLTDQKSSIESSSFSSIGGAVSSRGSMNSIVPASASHGRITYSLLNRYSFTFALREDASGRFGTNKYNLASNLGFNWSLKDELFLRHLNYLTRLNLRLSASKTGDYSAFASTGRPLTSSLSVQRSDRFNIGIEFSFFDKLFGDISYWRNSASDVFRFVRLPNGSNSSSTVVINNGKINSEGIEADIHYVVGSRKIYNWRLGLNFTYLSNKLDDFLNFWVTDGSQGLLYNESGQSVNSFRITKQIYDSDGSPLNLVGDRYTTNYTPDPRFIFGVSSALSVGKWNFDFLLRGSFGNYVYDYNGLIFGNLQGAAFSRNMTTDVLQTKLTTRNNDSDYYLQNASFLRAENIALGYSIENIFKSLRVNLLAIAQNAFVITNYTGQDPEVPNGIDFARYTVPRTFSLRLEIKGF